MPVLLALAAAASPTPAREQKTVFHGLPVEPDTGFLKPRDVQAIVLDPVWVFEGFAAPIAGDPAAVGSRLVAADTSGRLVALDALEGTPVWTVELGETLALGPAVSGDLVLQGTASGLLLALAVEDGRERWRAALGSAPAAPPILEGGRLLVVTAAPEAISIDRESGRVLSRLALPGAPFSPSIGPEGIVVATAPGQVVALGGEPVAMQWTRDLGRAITGPALADGKHVLVATDDRALWALRGRSGRTSWKQRVGSRVTARPRVVGDLLYVACWDNDLYVLGRKNGHILGRARLGHRLSGETTILGDHLFVAPATEATVVALSLPYLGVAGKHELGAPGEWFTTTPIPTEVLPGVAIGWGRATGRLAALRMSDAPPPPAPTERPVATPAPSATPH